MRYHRRNPEKDNWRLYIRHQKESRGHTAAVGICISCWKEAIFLHSHHPKSTVLEHFLNEERNRRKRLL